MIFLKKIFFLMLSLFSLLSVNSQEVVTIKEILNRSRKACLNIQAIEYKITQKGAKGQFGWPKIDATIIQQKAKVKNIGFDEAFIKAYGNITERGKTNSFSFSYNGDYLLFQKGNDTPQKKVTNLKRKTVMGLLQQHLFMLRIFPFAEEIPFRPRWSAYTYEKKDSINGEPCYKIKSEGILKSPTGAIRKTVDIWWISAKSYLPVAYTDNFIYKTITTKKINKEIELSLFSDNYQNEHTKEFSSWQIDSEIHKDKLLKTGAIAPKWLGKSENGQFFSSDNLKGKVYLVDFWGTWCPPCIKAMPKIEALYQFYKKNSNVTILGVSAKEKTPKTAVNYFKNKKYSYIHIPEGDSIADAFKVKIYPTLYVIDKHGKIIKSMAGFDTSEGLEKIKKAINQSLKL